MIDHAESAILYEQSNVFYENTCKTKSYTYTELYRIENIGNIFELKEKIRKTTVNFPKELVYTVSWFPHRFLIISDTDNIYILTSVDVTLLNTLY